MLRVIIFLLMLSGCGNTPTIAQNIDMQHYNGQWEGQIPEKALTHEITMEKTGPRKWQVSMSNGKVFYLKEIRSADSDHIHLELGEEFTFQGKSDKFFNSIQGYINSPGYKYHIELKAIDKDVFRGQWKTFYFEKLQPAKLYLAVENGAGENYEAYPIIADNRFRGTYVGDFKKNNDLISFKDNRTGYSFEGQLIKDKIILRLLLADQKVISIEMKRSESDWQLGTTAKSNVANPTKPVQLDDGIVTSSLVDLVDNPLAMKMLEDSIRANTLTNVHSVLISQNGRLIYENYFHGFDKDLAHDQRSAAKSIGSAVVGMAIEDGIFMGVNDPVFDYLPEAYQNTRKAENSGISIKHLLTMSSGMDAIDFGIDRMGQATEDNYQNTEDWLKTVLEAPMIFEPGAHANYGSANPFLLSTALAHTMDTPLLDYMTTRIFEPLGMTNYSISLDHAGLPYFGGGFYMIPRDMMKFGELYRQKGIWQGKRILSEAWVNESFKKHTVLENTDDKNEYGYLWWHYAYKVDDVIFNAVEARGAGGQYITIINDLNLTIVITSGNYRNGRYWQPEMIIEDYILPVFAR